MERGIGTTTNQIRNAPHGALFIWPNFSSLNYPRHIAHELKRKDLEIVSQEYLTSSQWRGRKFPAVVVDHSCHFSEEEYDALALIQSRVRMFA